MWWGSCARACCAALRRAGHTVLGIDDSCYLPRWSSKVGRIVRRICTPLMVKEYNEAVLTKARQFKPKVILAFKGTWLGHKTIERLRREGHFVVNYFADPSFEAEGKILEEAISNYSLFVSTKPYHFDQLRSYLTPDRIAFVPHGYDPDVHQKLKLTEKEIGTYGCDVSFIGTFTPKKHEILKMLCERRPDVNIKIWGELWQRGKSRALDRAIVGRAAEGQEYSKAVCAAKINLGLLRGPVKGCPNPFGDETTTRTYEIPACGGFMLHERTPEVLSLYEENKEMACFESIDELAEKIDFFLAHENERKEIAERGYERSGKSGYSYDNRMEQLIELAVKALKKIE